MEKKMEKQRRYLRMDGKTKKEWKNREEMKEEQGAASEEGGAGQEKDDSATHQSLLPPCLQT